jgi:hypothetical protein
VSVRFWICSSVLQFSLFISTSLFVRSGLHLSCRVDLEPRVVSGRRRQPVCSSVSTSMISFLVSSFSHLVPVPSYSTLLLLLCCPLIYSTCYAMSLKHLLRLVKVLGPRPDHTKPRFVTVGFSHFCEKARWALDMSGMQYYEEVHCPAMHLSATLGLVGVERVQTWGKHDPFQVRIHQLGFINSLPCPLSPVLCPLTPSSLPLYPLHPAPCPMPYALCPMSYTLYPFPYTLYPKPSAPCRVSRVVRPILLYSYTPILLYSYTPIP